MFCPCKLEDKATEVSELVLFLFDHRRGLDLLSPKKFESLVALDPHSQLCVPRMARKIRT
jgi:hypothetical protein